MEYKKISEFVIFNNEHLTKKIIYQDPNVLTFMLNLIPGQVLPRHGHEGGTLTIEIISGAGTIAINDVKQEMSKGQLFFLAGNDLLEVPVVTENLSLFVTIAPNPSNPMYKKGI